MNFGSKIVGLVTLLVVLTSYSGNVVAQTDTTTSLVNKTAAAFLIDEARRFYNEGNVRAALVKYREAYNKDPFSAKAAYGIGQCQYDIKNYGISLKYAREAIKLRDDSDAESSYLIARCYHRSVSLDSALMHYKIADSLMTATRSKDLNVKMNINEVQLASKLMNDTALHERILYTGEVNSGFQDYAPILADDGNRLYFISRRPNTTGGMVNPDDQLFFEDIFTAVWDDEKWLWTDVNNELKRINTDGFDAISHLSADGKTMYLTVNNTMVPKVKKRTQSSDIFVATLSDKGEWGTPKRLPAPINSSFYDGAATLTADGKTMYFVSERLGGQGSTDLYKSELQGKVWSKPVNLGAHINTIGRETTPFITPDGQYLFYSSDGLNGMGGYDVYVCKIEGNRISKPHHLGYGINTVNDDTHFRYYPEYRKGVLASIILIDTKSSYNLFSIEMGFFEYPKFEFMD